MEQIRLDLIPGKSAPVCHASQYDVGRTIRLNLVEGGSEYSIPSGTTAEIRIRKPDNNIISAAVTATQGNKYIDIVTAEQWTACAGTNLCEIVLTNGGNVIGTINFILEVEMDPIDGGSASESVIYNIQALVDTAVALHTFLIHITETTITETAADILDAINSNKILQVIYKPDVNSLTTHILPLTLDSGARPDGIRALAFAGFWGSKLYAADIVLDSIHSTVASLSMTNGKDLDETGDFPIHIHNSTITETAGEVLDAIADGLRPYVIWTNNSQSNYTFTYVLAAVWNPDATTETLIFGCPITGAVRTIHVYINPTTRTYSSSISIIDYNIPQINDSSTSSSAVWSAQKINAELAGKAEIDDTAVSSSTAWSSEQIVSLLPTESASGAVASFETPLTLPLVSHNVTIEPVQAGTGDPSPSNVRPISGLSAVNVTRTGKNLLPFKNNIDFTINGVRFYTRNGNFYLDGTATASISSLSQEFKDNFNITLKSTTYHFERNNEGYFSMYIKPIEEDTNIISNAGTATLTSDVNAYLGIYIALGKTFNNTLIPCQLELGSTPTTYEPYTGITVTITLGQTVYVGELDVTNGVLRVTGITGDLATLTGSYANGRWTLTGFADMKNFDSRTSMIAEKYKGDTTAAQGDENKIFTAYGNIYVYTSDSANLPSGLCVYELATPVEITLTPEQINTLKGVNNIWADTGDTAVEYKQDIQTYIDNRLSSGTRSLSLAKAPETKQEEEEGDESLTR